MTLNRTELAVAEKGVLKSIGFWRRRGLDEDLEYKDNKELRQGKDF